MTHPEVYATIPGPHLAAEEADLANDRLVDAVVLIVIDGLRPDALQQAATPNIDLLIAEGAHTMRARSVMPSSTLPCHNSMFRGVAPARHGIVTNTFVPLVRPVPSIIDVVHAAGRRTAAFYSWEQLRDLSDPGALDRSGFINNCELPDGDMQLAREAAPLLAAERPAFAFVYLGYTDNAGHEFGWMSAQYLAAVAAADQAVAVVRDALDLGRTAVILTADHGGHEQTHGTDMDEDLNIPWIVRTPAPATGHRVIDAPVSIIDTAPTIASLLGLAPPTQWQGTPVAAALSAGG